MYSIVGNSLQNPISECLGLCVNFNELCLGCILAFSWGYTVFTAWQKCVSHYTSEPWERRQDSWSHHSSCDLHWSNSDTSHNFFFHCYTNTGAAFGLIQISANILIHLSSFCLNWTNHITIFISILIWKTYQLLLYFCCCLSHFTVIVMTFVVVWCICCLLLWNVLAEERYINV